MKACVVGAGGFIGTHLVMALRRDAWNCFLPLRDDPAIYSQDLGHVFYCAGLTADFRQRPFATVEAHVQNLSRILEHARFDSLTYLSSTRVYQGVNCTSEDSPLMVQPNAPSDLYNLSKLMGESLCLSSGRTVRIARLSNVYGNAMPAKNFLTEVLREARQNRSVLFRSARDSEKDYISINDVVRILPRLASTGENGILNVASGRNIQHHELASLLEQQGIACEFEDGAASMRFPRIDTRKLEGQFGAVQCDLLQDFIKLLWSETDESN
ncbi:MAG: SDR family oxidoreductase [Undibacterium sp.]|nr:SDR family oxidoreductase [Undibacterium sp.]